VLRRVLILFAVVALAACSSGSSKHESATTSTVAVPSGVPTATVGAAQQRIDGFGASGAWWPNDLIKFPADVQKQVGTQLFDRTNGVSLSGYRFNIGGGGVGVTNPARATPVFAKDTAGRTFLKMASDAHVPLLTAFVNSAPVEFTTNGKNCGGDLKPGAEAAFAGYLANIVKTLKDSDQITINYVSPMNEPDDSFPDCGQEGMRVPVAQRAPLVNALAAALSKDAPWAKVIADETTADAILASEAPQWLGPGNTAKNLTAIAHHTYDFPNDALRKGLPPISEKYGVPTWMTEICCYKGSGGVATSMGADYDPSMTQGLWLADQIYSDLTVARDGAWYWWTALSPVLGCDPKADAKCPTAHNKKGFNDGLIYYDEHGATSGVTDLFSTRRAGVLGQFARFVPPGSTLHDVSGLPKGVRMMAFNDNSNWSVVAWNETAASAQATVAFPSGTQVHAGGGVQTDDKLILAAVPGAVATSNGSWLVDIPPQGVVTYRFTP
jgi:O-glycosyl hydrolase